MVDIANEIIVEMSDSRPRFLINGEMFPYAITIEGPVTRNPECGSFAEVTVTILARNVIYREA